MKVLVLVIYSNDLPVYENNLKGWRLYSKSNPSFDVYFMIHSKEVDKPELRDDILYLPGEENFATMPFKFTKSLEYFNYQKYDFVLRPNMSSFYVFHNLLPVLEALPKENLLAGECWGNFISGAGMIFSRDVCEILATYGEAIHKFKPFEGDDIRISQYLHFFHEIPYTQTQPKRYDVVDGENGTEEKIPSDVFHIRVKQLPEKRCLEYDIMYNLYKRFYTHNITSQPDESSSSQS